MLGMTPFILKVVESYPMNPQVIRRIYAESLRTLANIRSMRVVGGVGIYDCAGAHAPTAESQLRKFLNPDAAVRIHTLSAVHDHNIVKGHTRLVFNPQPVSMDVELIPYFCNELGHH